MSNSFYVDKILNKNNPNEGLIIDFKYPSGALFRGPPNRDLQARPKLCFSEHPLCRRIGVPGYYDTRFLFYNDLPSRLTNWNVPPVINLANSSHMNPNLADWIAPPVIDLANSRHANHNITDFIVPPMINLANSAPVDSTLVSNIRPHFTENPFESASSSVQKQGTFPKWHNISKTYPEQIQNKSSAFSEPTKNISKNGTVRDNKRFPESQRNSSLITSNADSSTSKKFSEKGVQYNEDFSESERRGSLIISNADSSTSKKSPERSINSSKTHPVQVINSSKTIPVQVTNSSRTLPNQVINSSKRSGQVRTEVKSFSNISPEQVQDISITNPIAREDIFSRWRQHILDNHAELATSNSRIFPETIQNIPGANPVQVQNAFPGWYCRLSTTLEETDVKEEFPPESDGKPKRKRTTFSSAQLVHLENNYTLENRYLTRLKRIQLAAELGLSEKQVKVWFQNRRVRDKPKDDIKPSMRGKRVKYEDIQVKNEMTNTQCNDSRGSTPPCENFTISNM